MSDKNIVVAIYQTHHQAENGVRRLSESGFPINQLSIVGRGYHTDEKVVGFYNAGDRIKLWGKYGAFWGAMWGLLLGGMFMTVPIIGPVVVLGHLGTILLGAVEGAVLVGGVSVLAGALASIGIPKDAVVRYETAVKEDRFLVVAHGAPEEIVWAKAILDASSPMEVDLHHGAAAPSAEHIHA